MSPLCYQHCARNWTSFKLHACQPFRIGRRTLEFNLSRDASVQVNFGDYEVPITTSIGTIYRAHGRTQHIVPTVHLVGTLNSVTMSWNWSTHIAQGCLGFQSQPICRRQKGEGYLNLPWIWYLEPLYPKILRPFDWDSWSGSNAEFATPLDHAEWILQQLKILFRTGTAHPKDVLPNGETLLHVSPWDK